MANRQALRDLQSRLAERLQLARSEGVGASWLAVHSSGRGFLFPLSQSGEIFPWSQVQQVPYTQAWFLGVANLRGGLFGVVDMSQFVGSGSAAAPRVRNEGVRNEARLIAVSAALDINVALLVDQLAGLRSSKAFASVAPPELGAPRYFGNVYTDSDGRHWQEINLQQLAQQSEFLAIAQ